jgi:hypothetical protein
MVALTTKCSRCGGEIALSRDEQFIECGWCSTPLYIHTEGNSGHFIVKPSLDSKLVSSVLSRWMSRLDYSGGMEITKRKLVYFPFWFFSTAEKNLLIPAASEPRREIRELMMGGGDMQAFSEEACKGAEVVEPAVYLSAARARFEEMRAGGAKPERADLIHYPVHFIEYNYAGRGYACILDAVSGEVHAHDRPPPESSQRTGRLLAMAAASFFVFFTIDFSLDSFAAEIVLDTVCGIALYVSGRGVVEGGNGKGGG